MLDFPCRADYRYNHVACETAVIRCLVSMEQSVQGNETTSCFGFRHRSLLADMQICSCFLSENTPNLITSTSRVCHLTIQKANEREIVDDWTDYL